MNILQLFEAGKPVMTDHNMDSTTSKGELVKKIHEMGAGKALEQILADPSKMLYRGIRNSGATIIEQDTLASTRSSQNTTNYVTLFTEFLPSWLRSGILPRSKIVSCTSSPIKGAEYGKSYVVLPTDHSSCTYVGADDFWNSFEGLNHIYGTEEGAVPAVNEAIHAETTNIIRTADQLKKFCEVLEQRLDKGTTRVERLNSELQALFEADESTHSLIDILDNLLDPSHMRSTQGGTLLQPGNFRDVGEEVMVGGNIVFIERDFFVNAFMPMGKE